MRDENIHRQTRARTESRAGTGARGRDGANVEFGLRSNAVLGELCPRVYLVTLWRFVALSIGLFPFVAREIRHTAPPVLIRQACIGALAMAGYLAGVAGGIQLGVPAGLLALMADLLPVGGVLISTCIFNQRSQALSFPASSTRWVASQHRQGCCLASRTRRCTSSLERNTYRRWTRRPRWHGPSRDSSPRTRASQSCLRVGLASCWHCARTSVTRWAVAD